MREILFRGKNDYYNKWYFGDLQHGGYYSGDAEIYIVDSSQGYKINYPAIPKTVGQFTGMTDKNGKKVFDGDVIKAIASNPVGEDIEAIVIVSLDDYELMWDIEHSHEIEVIGNIHDNPELLEGGA